MVMEAAAVVARVRTALPDAIVSEGAGSRDPWVQVAPGRLHDVLRLMRDADDLAFDFLMAVTGMDLAGLQETADLRVVYHLYSYRRRHGLNVRADVPRDAPVLPTAADLWPAADWAEREVLDLVGIRFEGHPDPRRLLLPPEWEGHPLRRDWKEGPTALGFPTTRGRPVREPGEGREGTQAKA
jgi:NADH-quinone oxidoreductase subunit C